MRGDGMSEENRNIIPLPGLYDRFVNRGMDLLEADDFVEAKKMFEQALSIEENGKRAHYGYIRSLLKSGEIDRAREHCEILLTKGFDASFELLQMYVSVLIKLKAYNEARMFIEALFQGNNIPPGEAESFYQLLAYCRQHTDGEDETLSPEPSQDVDRQRRLLESDDIEQQMAAVQMLRESRSVQNIEPYKRYISNNDTDPVLTSLMIQQLKHKQIEDILLVRKFDNEAYIDLQHIDDVMADRLSLDVKGLLAEYLEQENPTLFEMATEIWQQFVLTMYPFPIEPDSANVWAAAVHRLVHDMTGMTVEDVEIAGIYGIFEPDVHLALEKLHRMEGLW